VRWTYDEVYRAFVLALEEAGIPPDQAEPLTLDGRTRYYRIAGHRGRAKKGVYKIHYDERPAGYFKSLKAGDGVGPTVWCMAGADENLGADERRKRAEEWSRQKEQKERDEASERAQAVRKARLMWAASTEVNPRQAGRYLKLKGLRGAHGARQLGPDLIIPLTDGRDVMTVQTISPDGKTKLFAAGAPKRGGFFHIPRLTGEGAEPPGGEEAILEGGGAESGETEPTEQFKSYARRELVWLCEGFATGATLHELTGWGAVCAMDAGNLLPAARRALELHPGWTLVVAPDWDREHGNTGMSMGLKAAEELGLPIAPPPFGPGEEGTDWNDLCRSRGREKARLALRLALRAALSKPGLPEAERENLFPHVSEATGRPKGTVENLQALLRHLGIGVRYDIITKEVEIEIPGHDYGIDNALNAAIAWVTSECVKHGLPKSDVDGFLMNIAARSLRNPVLEWIESRPWDGRPHMDSLIDTIECPLDYPEDLKSALMSKWLVSGAAAAAMPRNFTTRGVLVLQGAQSLGKTSWLRRLCPPHSGWFFEGQTLDPANKDILKEFVSHWIVELGEFEGTLKKTDIARLKSFITKEMDTVRLPWAKKPSQFPRHTILCASVNQQEVLFDLTGNTRWWVIPCLKIDYRHGVDIQQAWAEALCRFRAGGEWWLTEDEERRLEEQNESFQANDPVRELLASKLDWGASDDWWEDRTPTEVLIQVGILNPTRGQSTAASLYLRKMGAKPGKRSNHARFVRVPPRKTH
jgi:putative DNA primase/helicase